MKLSKIKPRTVGVSNYIVVGRFVDICWQICRYLLVDLQIFVWNSFIVGRFVVFCWYCLLLVDLQIFVGRFNCHIHIVHHGDLLEGHGRYPSVSHGLSIFFLFSVSCWTKVSPMGCSMKNLGVMNQSAPAAWQHFQMRKHLQNLSCGQSIRLSVRP